MDGALLAPTMRRANRLSTTYCYVTGRGGSITNARHFTCEAHGLQFAAKYNLTQ